MTVPRFEILTGLNLGPTGTSEEAPQQWASTDLGNARRLVEAHGHDLRHVPQLGTFFAWDGQRYAEDLTGEAERRAKQVVDGLLEQATLLRGDDRKRALNHYMKSASARSLRAMVDLAKTEPGIPVTIDKLDVDPDILNVNNGVVDLRTGDLLPADRSRLVTKMAGTSYDPDAKAPTWDRFVREVFDGDDNLVGFIQRYAGYSLTADVREQKMVFAYGAGANGKSTLLNALRGAIGDYGLQLDPRVLMISAHEEHPTGLTDLRGARLVTTIETEAGRQLAEALVKQLTGGDPIPARRMRCDYFSFMPSHKLWFAGNHLPRIKGSDHAIWRRIAVVPFEVTFQGDHEDKDLAAKLTAERSGILAWMVRGCLEWRRGGLAAPERVQLATDRYREAEDHLGRFLSDCTTGDGDCYISARSLREAYEAWCRRNSERPWSPNAVGHELTRRGFDSAKVGRERSWLGIGLLEDAKPDENNGGVPGLSDNDIDRLASEE